MNELAIEKLQYLLTNPYFYLLIFSSFFIEKLLMYARRFYPKQLQEQIKEEEACLLEIQSIPERKRLNVFFLWSLFGVTCISALIGYITESIHTFSIAIFFSFFPLIGYITYKDHKINKKTGVTCKSKISPKYILGFSVAIILFAILIVYIFGKK